MDNVNDARASNAPLVVTTSLPVVVVVVATAVAVAVANALQSCAGAHYY